MSVYNDFINNVEKKTGLSIVEIREKDPCEMRNVFEKRFNSKMTITSEFPFIGRGKVLRDGIISHDKINKEVDKILQDA